MSTYSFTSGNLENLGGETDGAFDTELLVLRPVDEVGRDYRYKLAEVPSAVCTQRTLLQVLDVAARQSDTDFVDFGTGDGSTRGVVFFLSFGDVTHFGICE